MLDLNENTQIQNFNGFANSSDQRYPQETKHFYLLNDRNFGENKLETSTKNLDTSDAVASDALDDAGRDVSNAAASYALNTTGKKASTAVASDALDNAGRDALYATGGDTSHEGVSEAPNVTARDDLKENFFDASNISGNYNPDLLNGSESEPEGSNNAENIFSAELNKGEINDVKEKFVQFDQVIIPRGVNMLNTPEEMEKRFR